MLTPKPNGDYRFCVDYRSMNDATKSASWPIPNIAALLARLGTKKADTYGVMDLTSGYHQAPLSLATRAFTAFITFAGVFQFTRLPFGPKRAPSYFQQEMATAVLGGLIYHICEMYLDDCIVYGTGTDEFCTNLEKVFIRFEAAHLFLKASKCKLGLSEVEYVGKPISKAGITMSQKQIQGVMDFPKPQNNTQLRSYLGFVNYFRDHVPNHSNVVAPLHKMIDHSAKKQSKLTWTPEGATAFEHIKQLISRSPMLYFIHDTAPITLMTDASDYGVGRYLYQEIDGQKQLVALVSKALTPTQLRWSVIQKETYGIFFCCTQLDAMGARCRQLIAEPATAREKCRVVNRVLFHEYALRGNTDHYTDPLNSYLDQVLVRRKGIPISLSIVYLLVAERAGLTLSAVGLPGHFMVGCYEEHVPFFIDPFNAGVFLNAGEVFALLRSSSVHASVSTLFECLPY